MKTFRQFIVETIDVIVNGELSDEVINGLLDDFAIVTDDAKFIEKSKNKTIFNFQNRADADMFVQSCKEEKLKASISNTLRSPGQGKWKAYMVPKSILGVKQVWHGLTAGDPDEEDVPEGKYLVTKTWLKPEDHSPKQREQFKNKFGIFSPVDEHDPKKGGVIGLGDPMGEDPDDMASAAHESYHAYLHLNKNDWENELLVNYMAAKWLKKNFTGDFLALALERLKFSNESHAHNIHNKIFKNATAIID